MSLPKMRRGSGEAPLSREEWNVVQWRRLFGKKSIFTSVPANDAVVKAEDYALSTSLRQLDFRHHLMSSTNNQAKASSCVLHGTDSTWRRFQYADAKTSPADVAAERGRIHMPPGQRAFLKLNRHHAKQAHKNASTAPSPPRRRIIIGSTQSGDEFRGHQNKTIQSVLTATECLVSSARQTSLMQK